MRAAILFAIADRIEAHGYSPTVREIGADVGLSSSSTVTSHLERMRASGLISYNGMPRTISIAKPYIYRVRRGSRTHTYISRGWRARCND